MSSLTMQELGIVVACSNYNPTVLNPDFLQYSGVLPSDWNFARPPVYTNQLAQIIYQNGVSIIAQPDRLIFAQRLGEDQIDPSTIVRIVHAYLNALPNAEYQGISINPRGYIPHNNPDGIYGYLSNILLRPGAWSDIGQTRPGINLDLSFDLDQRRLNLNITEATLKHADDSTQSIIVFSGSFIYPAASNNRDNRLHKLHQTLDSWQSDLDTYQDIIQRIFLSNADLNDAVHPTTLTAVAG